MVILICLYWTDYGRVIGVLFFEQQDRAADKDHFLLSRMAISSPNPMFDHFLESSHRDDSHKWSNIGFDEEITQVESIEIKFTNLI